MFPLQSANTASGYFLQRSLRFRASASAYLSRTPATSGTGATKTWTFSTWVKRGKLGSRQSLLDGYLSSAGDVIEFSSSDNLEIYRWGAGNAFDLVTTQVFRDPSAWYHIIVAFDTTQATASNRIKVYVNGVQVTAFSTATYPPVQNQGSYISDANLQDLGRRGDNQFYFDGYQTETYFIDGQALTPSSFGSTNSTTGVWQPAKYTGTYGTNGFYLPFTDNSALTTSSNVGLGKDFSGNGNYWTTNNISITSGVTYDSMTDVPTLTSATAANFAVLNPLDNATPTLTNANLTPTSSGSWGSRRSTIGMTSGKWYCEVTSGGSTSNVMLGIISDSSFSGSTYIGAQAQGYGYLSNGDKYNNLSNVAYGATYTSGDVIGIVFDADARTLTFYKNNVSQGVAYSSIPAGTFYFAVSVNTTGFVNANFGQRPFTYTPPTGFVALNTFNLPDSTIKQGNKVMDATLYTGNGTTQTITNAGGFKPDLVWIKSRSTAISHGLFDSVRGTNKTLYSNLSAAEDTYTDTLNSFNTNGFTLGSDATWGGVNVSGRTYVGWQWQAGQGTTSTNTSGTITSTVSVNATAGFSVVTYTGNGANATVGHGLGVAPKLIIVKCRNTAGENWQVYSSSLADATYRLTLNTSNAVDVQTTMWNSTAPTSSVFSIGTATGVNANTQTYVAYCFAKIEGYSSFGRYVGNGSSVGTFVFTNTLSKFVLIKRIDAAGSWYIYDTTRNTYNVVGEELYPNSSSAASSATDLDIVSNGFKLRTTAADLNASGGTYIYYVAGSNPFKNALAR